jgi:spore coat polysaccharide biosynthesis protein SpsF
VRRCFRAADLTSDPYDREHVTPFLRRDGRFLRCRPSHRAPRRPELRLSVDTADDLDFMRRLFAVANDVLALLPRRADERGRLLPRRRFDGLRDVR